MKNRHLSASKGFTLIEIVIAILLFGMVWTALVGTLVVGKGIEVIARHKVQATYAAQKAIELQRRLPFHYVYPDHLTSVTTSTVTIDPRDPDDPSDDFTGMQTITVTAIPPFANPRYSTFGSDYGSSVELKVAYYNRVFVKIEWRERLSFGSSFPMTETLGTYIANDPQAN